MKKRATLKSTGEIVEVIKAGLHGRVTIRYITRKGVDGKFPTENTRAKDITYLRG